jgi:hypothetical protein
VVPVCRHVFGCRGDLRDGLHQVDEQNLLYVAGHNLVLYNIELRTQRFIGGSQDVDNMCAVAVAPSKKHVAVAERAEKGTVTVFDLQTLKRRKVLTSYDGSAKVRLYVSVKLVNGCPPPPRLPLFKPG